MHTLSLGSFIPLPWLVMSGKMEATFRPRLFEFYPTNSQPVSLPMMDFEYINGLPPIYYSPFWPKIESWPTWLWVTYWSIPLALRSLPTLREILDPIKRGYPLYLFFVQPYILCSPNSKGKIKYVKFDRMA